MQCDNISPETKSISCTTEPDEEIDNEEPPPGDQNDINWQHHFYNWLGEEYFILDPCVMSIMAKNSCHNTRLQSKNVQSIPTEGVNIAQSTRLTFDGIPNDQNNMNWQYNVYDNWHGDDFYIYEQVI